MENKTVGTMQDKIAIITGASRGLGRNTAINLARRGVDVIFTYRSNETEAQNLINDIEAIGKERQGCISILAIFGHLTGSWPTW